MNIRELIFAGLAALLWSAGSLMTPAAAAGTEAAVGAEVNPPGDIPDDQVFVRYVSPEGYSLKVPEGWAHADTGGATTFSDKYDRIAVTITASSAPLDLPMARKDLAPSVESGGRAVKVDSVKEAKLPAGRAIVVAYTANSDPNSVTGKQIRLEAVRYYFAKGGKLAALDLSAPKGADNVDQWKLISSSFRFK